MREALDKALADIAIEKQIREQLILAVNEACMNVIQHAYCGDHQGEIRLTLEHDGRRLRFLVEDDAPCIDPTCITPRDLTDIRPGGLGVHFIREIMDEVRFSPTGGQGNKLEMIKHLDTIGPN
ncbi:MAG: ATP-binding protein [Candidatus Thiodiazotropha sp. (ex Monitilora ramsayi)]|nr:ATP-binding protein [Candidatus Thiodiazotropha sp. (ex Monitilora ramsayi)]